MFSLQQQSWKGQRFLVREWRFFKSDDVSVCDLLLRSCLRTLQELESDSILVAKLFALKKHVYLKMSLFRYNFERHSKISSSNCIQVKTSLHHARVLCVYRWEFSTLSLGSVVSDEKFYWKSIFETLITNSRSDLQEFCFDIQVFERGADRRNLVNRLQTTNNSVIKRCRKVVLANACTSVRSTCAWRSSKFGFFFEWKTWLIVPRKNASKILISAVLKLLFIGTYWAHFWSID